MLGKIIGGYREAFSGVPRYVWLMSLILLVSRSGTMVLPFLSIYGSRELGFRPMTIGWLLGAYGVGGILAGLLSGKLIGWIGAIPTQIISLTLAIPAFLAVGQARSFESVAACLFLLSVTVEAMRPACTTATVEFCENEGQHVKAMAVNRLAVNVGMTLGPALGGFLTLLSYQLLFYANAASTFGALLLTLFFFGWNFHQKDESLGEQETTTNEGNLPGCQESEVELNRSPFLDMRFVAFCLINCLAACVLFQFHGTYPLYLKEQYQFQEYHIGLLYSVNTVVIVLFEMVLVHLIRQWPQLKVYAWGQFLSCVGFGLLPLGLLWVSDRSAIEGSTFVLGFAYCSATMLVLTIGEMLTMPLGPAYAAKLSNRKNRGRYMGLFAASFSLASLLAPLVGMALYEWKADSVGYASMAIGVVVCIATLLLARGER